MARGRRQRRLRPPGHRQKLALKRQNAIWRSRPSAPPLNWRSRRGGLAKQIIASVARTGGLPDAPRSAVRNICRRACYPGVRSGIERATARSRSARKRLLAGLEVDQFWRPAGWSWLSCAKNAPAFFNARTADIQKAIKDATGLKLEAEFRSSEIDRKMATLDAEIRRMRDASRAEMNHECARIDHDTSAALNKIHEHTAREIEALQHQARNTLREHAVQLAVDSCGRSNARASDTGRSGPSGRCICPERSCGEAIKSDGRS